VSEVPTYTHCQNCGFPVLKGHECGWCGFEKEACIADEVRADSPDPDYDLRRLDGANYASTASTEQKG
jgi:hypothetical protein